jgi:two-component system, NarL family, sensor kinase
MSQLALSSTVAEREPVLPAPTEEEESDALRRRIRRLALDVHDGPMQILVAVGYGLGLLGQHLRSGSLSGEAAAAELESLVSELADTERGMRDLITTLESTAKTDLDSLESIARSEVERFRRLCGAEVELTVPQDVWPDSHSQEIAIRAVLGESLNNVAKHAAARRICVSLHADDSVIRLDVADDGDGFDPLAVDGDRIGLVSMRERLHLLGGHLAIESKRGGPTRVRATFRRWRPDD